MYLYIDGWGEDPIMLLLTTHLKASHSIGNSGRVTFLSKTWMKVVISDMFLHGTMEEVGSNLISKV
jgi:hypothetical protein